MSLPQIIYGYDEFGEVSLQILVEVVGGQLKITVLEGAANINGIFAEGTGDSLDGFTTNKKGAITDPVNMNGSTEDWDSGFKLSDPGLGQNSSTYLTEGGPSLFVDVPADWDLNDITTIGIRATSTTTAAGSIKGVGEQYEPEIDTVTAVDDDPACGVEGQYKPQSDTNDDGKIDKDDEATYVAGTGVPVVGNVLDNDTDSLVHDLDITHVNGFALADLDAAPDGTVYEFAITDGTLKIDAETGDFEFTYTGPNLPVGAPDWEGSFTYTVTDGDDSNDSADSVHTATVDLCIDAAGASHGYWINHDFSDSEGFAGAVGTTNFDEYFQLDDGPDPIGDPDPLENPDQNDPRTWTDKVGSSTVFFADDLSFSQAVTFGNGNGTGDFTVPDVTGTTAEADLVREAASAVLNYYDADSSDAFVTAYIYQRNLNDNDLDATNNPTDAASALDDLKAQVQATFDSTAGAYTVDELASLLHLTHE